MKRKNDQLEQRITSLLADPDTAQNYLHGPLAELWQAHCTVLERLERITQVSDAYQSHARQRELTQTERVERQLRQLEKLARISDRYQLVMQDLNQALKRAAVHDALTGLANRRLLLERLKAEVERSARGQRTFCVAMLDVDHFKAINDTYGHDKGDEVLVELARVLEASVREYDLCGRWGGEEFLILLPDCTLEMALLSLKRVCDAVRGMRLRSGTDELNVNLSVGLAEAVGKESYSDTVNRADQALLQAKRNGRDRIELAVAPTAAE